MKTNKRYFAVLAVIVILLASLSVGASQVSAQSMLLFLSPDPASIYLNTTNSTVVDLWVSNGNILNAFDVTITYDTSIVQLTGWVNGGYMNISGGCIINQNQPGFFWLVCTQLNKPGVSGDGVLLKLTFTGKDFGSTPVTIAKAEFANKLNELVIPALEHGQINTLYQPGTVVNSSFSGEISLQGTSLRAGIPVTLNQGQYLGVGPYTTTAMSLPANNYSVNPIVMDAYILTTAFPRYLNVEAGMAKTVGILRTHTVAAPLMLLSGNAVWQNNNEINLSDLDAIRDAFDGSGAGLNEDVNYDGVVDVRDLALAGGNFGMNSSSAYGGWVP